MPPGTTPPLIIQYNASTVPILQYSFSSPKMSEQALFDVTANQVRVGLASTRGAMIPWPYGGKQRVVEVDLNLPRSRRKISAAGRGQRHQRPEPGSAQRHGQNRRDGI
jgi:multidrug efflux pump subunit AcrB